MGSFDVLLGCILPVITEMATSSEMMMTVAFFPKTKNRRRSMLMIVMGRCSFDVHEGCTVITEMTKLKI
jgi:hypothetical protein